MNQRCLMRGLTSIAFVVTLAISSWRPVPEPTDLHSEHGVLKVDLSIHDFKESDGSTRYCYLLPDGGVARDCTEGAAARQPFFIVAPRARG